MFLEEIQDVLPGQRVKIKYDCEGGFKRCGKEYSLKLMDALENFNKNDGKHICRSCQLKANNPAKKPEVKEKMKKTNIEKYGNVCPLNTAENTSARVEKMFGTEDSTKKIVAKRKKTSQERYGADHIMKTEEGLRRVKEAMQERLGVDYSLQSEECKEKMRKTCIERYGVENPLSLPEVRAKGAATSLELYGVEHYNQLPEMKEYLRENCPTWLADSYANPWAKGIIRPEEWNEKQSKTMADKILKGEFNPQDSRFFVTGYFTSDKCKKKPAFFRSSLELVMHYLLNNDNDVEWYENEPFQIEYEKSPGIIRRYIPDFFVMKKSRGSIIEMKPAFRMREEETQQKVIAGKKFAEINGFDFSYVDEHELIKSGVFYKDLIGLPNVIILKK